MEIARLVGRRDRLLSPRQQRYRGGHRDHASTADKPAVQILP